MMRELFGAEYQLQCTGNNVSNSGIMPNLHQEGPTNTYRNRKTTVCKFVITY